MANYTSTQDLVNGALHRAGELTDGSSSYESKALEYINKWHLAVIAGATELGFECGEPWSWAKSKNPGVLILEAPYSTGTISLTNGSTSGTFSGAPAASQAGKWLRVVGREEVFRISAHTAGQTAFTLDAAYSDETGSGLSYEAHKLDYDLTSGLLRLISAFRTHRSTWSNNGQVTGMDLSKFQELHPVHEIVRNTGVPTSFTEIYRTEGLVTVRFNRSPDENVRMEYDYIPIPSDLTDSNSNYPLVPREHRVLLEYGAAYNLCIDKNDNRAQVYQGLVQAALEALVQAHRKERTHRNSEFGKLHPRQEQVAQKRLFRAGDYE